MRLFELQAGQIDKELDDVAKKTGDKALPGDKTVDDLNPEAGDQEQNPNDPMMGGMGGDMGMGGLGGGGMGGDPMGPPGDNPVENPDQEAAQQEWDETLKKKIDQFLITSMQAHPYARNWRHKDGSKTNPLSILSMDNSDLTTLRNIARNKIAMMTMQDQLGTYDDPQMKYLTELYSFVEKVIQLKNQKAAENKPTSEKRASSAKDAWNPKTKAGKHKDYKSFVAKR